MADADAWVSGSPRIDDRGSIAAPWLPLDKPTSDEFISLLRTQIANDRLATQSAANDLAAELATTRALEEELDSVLEEITQLDEELFELLGVDPSISVGPAPKDEQATQPLVDHFSDIPDLDNVLTPRKLRELHRIGSPRSRGGGRM